MNFNKTVNNDDLIVLQSEKNLGAGEEWYFSFLIVLRFFNSDEMRERVEEFGTKLKYNNLEVEDDKWYFESCIELYPSFVSLNDKGKEEVLYPLGLEGSLGQETSNMKRHFPSLAVEANESLLVEEYSEVLEDNKENIKKVIAELKERCRAFKEEGFVINNVNRLKRILKK